MQEQTQPTQLNETTTRDRLAPYKLYSFLLNSELPSIKHVGPWRVSVKTGPLSRKFRCRHSRIHEWLYWLEQRGLIEVTSRSYGVWEVNIHIPKIAN